MAFSHPPQRRSPRLGKAIRDAFRPLVVSAGRLDGHELVAQQALGGGGVPAAGPNAADSERASTAYEKNDASRGSFSPVSTSAGV